MAYKLSSPYTESLVLVLLLLATKVQAKVPAIYVFGDSLADVGNNNHLELSSIRANFAYNGVDYPLGEATGRFSNGKICPDFLADKLGLPYPPAYLSIPANSNTTNVFLQGVNFASGGAGVLDSTRIYECFSLTKQIDYYSIVYADLVEKLGAARAQDHLSRSIFAFLVGSNDILDFANSDSRQRDTTAQQLLDLMISSTERHFKRVYKLGARKFLFMGTGPIGCCPQQRGSTNSGECNAMANAISAQYEDRVALLLQKMKSELRDMNYSFFNSSSALMHYIENPGTYGFDEVKEACCGIGPPRIYACLPVSELCHNRTSYVFWDPYHPTEAAVRLLTETLFDGSLPRVFPINAKQLSDL